MGNKSVIIHEMELTPQVEALYKLFLTKLNVLGKVMIEEKNTSIHLKNRIAFAGIHPHKKYFSLTIVSSVAIHSPRIAKQEQVSKNRFHNEVKVERIQDIDEQLLSWLEDAYNLTK
jgi:hypothetical protein